MEVILLDNIGKLGELGDKVTVKPGYGRNYLVPYGLAVPATKDNVAAFESQRAELEAQAAARKAEAESRAEQLSEIELSLVAKAGDEGKLFGSIGPRDLAEALVQAGLDVAKSEVRIRKVRFARPANTTSRCSCTPKSVPAFASWWLPSNRSPRAAMLKARGAQAPRAFFHGRTSFMGACRSWRPVANGRHGREASAGVASLGTAWVECAANRVGQIMCGKFRLRIVEGDGQA